MFVLGGLQVLVTTALLAAISMLLGLGGPASVAIGAALSLSSTAIVLRLLAERRDMHSRFGRGALGILMTQDLAVGPLLVLIPALRGTPLEMTGGRPQHPQGSGGDDIISASAASFSALDEPVAATRSKEIFTP
jgi:predicted Kef-type K+ transport protein